MAKDRKQLKRDFTNEEIVKFRNRKFGQTYEVWCISHGYDEEAFRLAVYQFRKRIGPWSSGKKRDDVESKTSRLARRVICRSGVNLASIMCRQGCRCVVCSKDLIAYGYHLDHIMPVSLGGVNEAWNIQFLCDTCNLRKSNQDPFEWSRRLGVQLPTAFVNEYNSRLSGK